MGMYCGEWCENRQKGWLGCEIMLSDLRSDITLDLLWSLEIYFVFVIDVGIRVRLYLY